MLNTPKGAVYATKMKQKVIKSVKVGNCKIQKIKRIMKQLFRKNRLKGCFVYKNVVDLSKRKVSDAETSLL